MTGHDDHPAGSSEAGLYLLESLAELRRDQLDAYESFAQMIMWTARAAIETDATHVTLESLLDPLAALHRALTALLPDADDAPLAEVIPFPGQNLP